MWSIAAPFLVGYRDVLLLLAIYLYFLIQGKNNPVIHLLLEISLGLVVAIGFYWSFDRGIAGVVSLGASCIILAYKNRLYIVSLIIFIITFFSLGYFSPELSLGNYWENVKFLAATSSNWSYGWQRNPVILTVFLGLSNVLANWLLWSSSIVKSKTIGVHFANILFLSAISLILFKIGINRADSIHILWGLWGPCSWVFIGSPIRMKTRSDLSYNSFWHCAVCYFSFGN